MTAYQSVVGETVTQKVIEKSKFITYVSHVEDEEQAKEFLARIRAEHMLATHVCFGFIADVAGNLQRFSDDGEPQGTAGMPILNVIKAQKLVQTAVAVVRYFGGIKLGAGGLTRAYASSASEGISAANVRIYEESVELSATVDYPEVNAITRFLSDYEVTERNFLEQAEFTVIVQTAKRQRFEEQLRDCLNGKVNIVEKNSYFYAFPLDK